MNNKDRINQARKEFKKPRTPFAQMDLTNVPKNVIPKGMTRAFRNNRYMVMVYDDYETTKGKAIKVLIQRHDNAVFPDHWQELQKIKNEVFGSEVMAIEYFPAESRKIDDYNIYWLFIFPKGVLPELL